MQDKPLVSVIVTTYKRAQFLDRAINSLLKQDYIKIEVIVVDDNNSDSIYRINTEEKMKKYSDNKKIVYIKHERNLNGANARNTGIKSSNGKYITFLDDDDVFIETRITKLVNEMEQDVKKEYGCIYSDIEIISNKNKELLSDLQICESGTFKRELLLKEFTIGTGSNMFFRKEIITKLKGFDTRFKRHQDWEFLIRFFRESKIKYYNEVLAIKYMDSRINFPDSYVLEDVKQLYLTTFKEDIKLYHIDIQNKIRFVHEEDMIFSYLNDLRIRKALNLINSNKSMLGFNHYKKIFKILFKAVVKKLIRIKRL